MAVTINTLREYKRNGEKFPMLTAYDSTFAQAISAAGIDVLLIGDSLGMVLQGHDSTLPVTVEDIAYHTACVARGNQHSLIMSDLPFMSYGTPEDALRNAAKLMQAGAHMVKIEGTDWLADTIRLLTERGVPVCAHLGLTPQFVNKFGGYKVQGRDERQAGLMVQHSRMLEQAGADVIVLECVPSALAARITEAVTIPVVGIGAGPDTDGQVLVMHDMLGLGGRKPRFVKNFLEDAGSIQGAFEAFASAVRESRFPAPEHCFSA